MAKRKRDDDDAVPERSGGAKQYRIEHKLKQASFQVKKAFEIAQRFERQKLSRRRKNAVAQGVQKDVDRIDCEISALKVR